MRLKEDFKIKGSELYLSTHILEDLYLGTIGEEYGAYVEVRDLIDKKVEASINRYEEVLTYEECSRRYIFPQSFIEFITYTLLYT